MRLCDRDPFTMCDECKEKYIVNFTRDDCGEDEEFICCDSYTEAQEVYKKLSKTGRFCGIRVKPFSVILLLPKNGREVIDDEKMD